MGNFKEIGQAVQTNLLGIGYALHRGHYTEALGRTAMIPFNLASRSKERNNALSAVHQFDVKFSVYEGKRDLLMIDRNGFLPSPATSLRESDINYLASLQREGKNTDAARFQWRHNLRLIETIYSLSQGETLVVFLPHGGKIEDGVALAQYTRTQDGALAQSRLLPKLNEQEGRQILEGLVNLGGEQANLKDGQDSILWSGVKLNDHLFNFTERPEEVNNFLTGILGADFLQREIPTCLDGGSCSSSTGQGVTQELKPVLALNLASTGGGASGEGGGGSGKETLSTSAVSITQFVDAKVIFTTALRSNVVNNNDNPVNAALSESASLFDVTKQNSGRMTVLSVVTTAAAPLFASRSEPTSMFRIIEENSERAESIAKKELVQPSVLPSVFQAQALIVSEVVKENLATVKTQRAPIFSQRGNFEQIPIVNLIHYQPTVGYEVKEVEERWQTKDAVACLDCHNQDAVVTEKTVVAQTEQQPLLEKAVKEFNLPLLEISSETVLMMAVRAVLKPVVRGKEKAVDDEVIFVDNKLQSSVEEKIMVEVDQKQSKLFLVENFSVTHGQMAKAQDVQPFQLKKMFWRIKAPESEPEISILEFELPKDQKLYALYHFLQKVVKKVIGEDVIRTRQVTVMVEKKAVDLDLELMDEIEYYLQLLRRKNYAQAFAVVN